MEPEQITYTGLDEVLQALKAFIESHGNKQGKAAEALGISRAFLWKVQTGRKNISQDILDKLGYELTISKTYTYTKKEEQQ